MSEEIETILRKSLNEVDRSRRWQIAGLVILVLAFVLQAWGVTAALHGMKPQTAETMHLAAELRLMLRAGLWFMVYTVGFCTLGICFFVSRMTKKVLRAIELASSRTT